MCLFCDKRIHTFIRENLKEEPTEEIRRQAEVDIKTDLGEGTVSECDIVAGFYRHSEEPMIP